ncbi:MAG: VanZ family protein [Myxococcota bacterium]
MSRPRIKAWISAWAPPVIWATVIWQLGTDGLSETHTRSLVGRLLDWVLPGLTAENLASLVWLLRTLAHPAVYGLLALLCWRAASLTFEVSHRGRTFFGLIPVVLLALSDEWRQGSSQLRSGAWGDVLLDLAGGGLAVLALGWWEAQRGQRLFGGRRAAGRSPPNSAF